MTKTELLAGAALVFLTLDGCCCSIVSIASKGPDGTCWVDRYNCTVDPLTHIDRREVPCDRNLECELTSCTASAECFGTPACASSLASTCQSDGGRYMTVGCGGQSIRWNGREPAASYCSLAMAGPGIPCDAGP